MKMTSALTMPLIKPYQESHEQDTSLHHNSFPNHQTQLQDELAMIPEEVEEQSDPADQDHLSVRI